MDHKWKNKNKKFLLFELNLVGTEQKLHCQNHIYFT